MSRKFNIGDKVIYEDVACRIYNYCERFDTYSVEDKNHNSVVGVRPEEMRYPDDPPMKKFLIKVTRSRANILTINALNEEDAKLLALEQSKVATWRIPSLYDYEAEVVPDEKAGEEHPTA